MKNFSALLLLILIPCSFSYGQDFLLFQNKQKKALYYVGNPISFRLKDKSKISGSIQGFEDSIIVFKNRKVVLNEIAAVYVDDKIKGWYALRYKTNILIIAGVVYLFADFINHWDIDERTVLVSGSLIGSGFLLKWIIGNKIKVTGGRRLKIVEQ